MYNWLRRRLHPAPTEPAPAVPAETDPQRAAILVLWKQHRELSRRHRLALKEFRLLRLRLGAGLAAEHDRQESLGSESNFNAWLREHQIPRATAYRLIAAHRKATAPEATGPKPPRPSVEIRGCTLIIRFELDDLRTLAHYMVELESGPHPFPLLEAVLGCFITRTPNNHHNDLQRYWRWAEAEDRADADYAAGLSRPIPPRSPPFGSQHL